MSELTFGFTLSTKHRYAIIPVPAVDIRQAEIEPDRIGELLRQYIGYNETDGPMKAIITADSEYVGRLIEEFEQLMGSGLAVAYGGRPVA